MSLPNYIIAGAQRSGTTSLHNWLMAHPGVWDNGEPRREVHFASYQFLWDQGVRWYKQQFKGRGLLVGEKSPTYLDHPLAPKRLKTVNPHAKIIFLLRNPVARVWSHWRKARAKGFEPDKFGMALRFEPQRLADEEAEWGTAIWRERYYLSCHHVRCYLRRSQYAMHLRHWFKHWERHKILILKSEEMFNDPEGTYRAVLAFLGLPMFKPPRWKRYQKISRIDWQMPEYTREQLEKQFGPWNERLAELLGDKKWLW